MVRPYGLGGVLLVSIASACAPSLSTFQPAHVAPKGHLQAAAGMELSIAPGSIADAVDTAQMLADRIEDGQSLTTDEKVQLFDGGVRLLLNPPISLPTTHMLISYVPVERLELSVRYAGGAWRLGGRFQLADRETGPCDITVGLGISRFAYEFPISDVISVLKLDDFSRWQLDVPLLFGTARNWMRVWAGPKVLLTSFGTKLRAEFAGEQLGMASFDGTAIYFGGQGGIAFGYRWLFVAFELTMMQMMGSATSSVTIPNVVDPIARDTSLRGTVIFPSFGLMAEF